MTATLNYLAISEQLHWVAQRIENLANEEQNNFYPLPAITGDSAYASFVSKGNHLETDRIFLN